MKGRVDIIDKLMSTCPDSIQNITDHRKTSPHLSMNNYQFDAFRILIEWLERLGMQTVVNLADCDENTALHIVVLTKQHAVCSVLSRLIR